jgi:hypothetical protein
MSIYRIQMRRGTAAEWAAANPILSSGEHGYETDTGREKIGDGSTSWLSLPYYGLSEANVISLIEQYAIGQEMDYSERIISFTTTNTVFGSVAGAAKIGGILCEVTGLGRPVDIEFFAPNIYHSVANTLVQYYLIVDGASFTTNGQIGAAFSPSITIGPDGIMKRRIVLDEGVDYTFEVGVSGAAAGTCTLDANAAAQISLAVTAR